MSGAAEMSKPCFFWQGPPLEGLGNARRMRGGEGRRQVRELYHIRLFRLDSGGPPQMEEKDSVT